MSVRESCKLAPGIYRLFWKDGSPPSLAAVGVTVSGSRWYAPINWVEVDSKSRWVLVGRVELVTKP
jgi:hypothetical protein